MIGFFFAGHHTTTAGLASLTEELLRRLPDLTGTDEPVEYRWGAGNIMSIARVPVRFTPIELDRKVTVGV